MCVCGVRVMHGIGCGSVHLLHSVVEIVPLALYRFGDVAAPPKSPQHKLFLRAQILEHACAQEAVVGHDGFVAQRLCGCRPPAAKLTGTPTARGLFVPFLPSRPLKWGFRMFFRSNFPTFCPWGRRPTKSKHPFIDFGLASSPKSQLLKIAKTQKP
jgi:hypothetical protein